MQRRTETFGVDFFLITQLVDTCNQRQGVANTHCFLTKGSQVIQVSVRNSHKVGKVLKYEGDKTTLSLFLELLKRNEPTKHLGLRDAELLILPEHRWE